MKEVKVKLTLDDKDAKKGLKDLNKQVDKTAKSTKKSGEALSGGFAGLKGAIGGAIPMLGRLQAAFASSGIGAIVIAVGALVGLFTSAVTTGAKFAKSFSTLQAVTGKTADELSSLNKQAKELGATTQFTAIQVVSLQTELAKLGFTVKDIENSTPSILDLAASLEVDLASAAELAGSVVRSFGLTTEDTQKVVDVMAKSTSTSALNFEALRESLKVVAPAARATGVSIEKTAALLGVLANNGLKGSVAGTGLSKTFIELNKKGITLQEAMDKVSGSSNKLNTAIELVGVVGAKSFLSLAEGGDQIAELEEQFENAAGAAKEMAEVRLDNLTGDTTKLGSAWEGFLLSIEDGSNIINNLVRGFIQAGTAVLSFLTPTKDLADALRDEQTELFLLESQLLDTNTSERERVKIIKGLQDKYPDFLKNISAEKVTNQQLKTALKGVNEQLIQKILISSQEEELAEKLKKAGEDAQEVGERTLSLREQIARNNRKFNLEAIEGTLEEQAAEQKRQLLEKQGVTSTIELQGSIKDGYTAQAQAAIDLEKGVKKLNGSQEDYNESLEVVNKTTQRNKEILAELGIVLDDTNDSIDETVEATTNLTDESKSLIAIQEALLENAKLLPETTEAELIAKNKLIAKIDEEIKKLKELGVEKSDKKEETPEQKAKRIAAEEKKLQEFTANTKKEARDLERQNLKLEFEELLLQVGEDNAKIEELEKSHKERLAALNKKFTDEDAVETAKTDKTKEEQAQAVADAEVGIQIAKFDAIGKAFSILGDLANENKALQAASLIGESAVGISKMVIGKTTADLADTAYASSLGPAGAAYLTAKKLTNKINLGIGIASNVAATAKGLAALGKGGAPQGGDEGAEGGAEAPAFNLVEGSESNAIQQSIQGQESAVKAYVVSGEVTTAQSADRNIVEGSGF